MKNDDWKWIAVSALALLLVACAGYVILGESHDGGDDSIKPVPDIPVRYTVSFDSNGGEGFVASQTVESGTLLSEPREIPTIPGHVLAGWREAGADRDWDFRHDTVTHTTKLEARWIKHFEASVYENKIQIDMCGIWSGFSTTISFPDGGVWDNLLSKGESMIFERIGYTSGVLTVTSNYFGKDYSSSMFISMDEGSNVKETTTIIFDPANGDSIITMDLPFGTRFDAPVEPTRDGYTFTGWRYNNYVWIFSEPATRDMVLVANWVPIDDDSRIKYQVLFDVTGAPQDNIIENICSGCLAFDPGAPAKPGHIFLGWTDENGKYWDFLNDTVDSPTVLRAQWMKVFDVSKISLTAKVNLSQNIDSDSIFIEWGDGKSNISNQSEMSLSHRYSASGNYIVTVTLWLEGKPHSAEIMIEIIYSAHVPPSVKNTVLIQFNNDSRSDVTVTVSPGTLLEEPPSCESDRYIFNGWYGKVNFGKPIDSNVTLTAKWTVE